MQLTGCVPFVVYLGGNTQRVNPPAPVMGSAAQRYTFPVENALANEEEVEVIHKSVIKGKLKTESTAAQKAVLHNKKRGKKRKIRKNRGYYWYSNYSLFCGALGEVADTSTPASAACSLKQ